tara:strand:+ start:129 stop:656 length:528 start_codon:yes stop_codon:yes gene_type:complete
LPKKIDNFSNLYFKPSPSIGFSTPTLDLSVINSTEEEKRGSYLSQIKKYSRSSHMFDSQISFGYGCTDAEFISLFKMTKEYSKDKTGWDRYIKKTINESYSNYPDGLGCCPVHKILWIETKIFGSFFPNHAPDLEKMLLKHRSNRKYINTLNNIIVLINNSRISSLRSENKHLMN